MALTFDNYDAKAEEAWDAARHEAAAVRWERLLADAAFCREYPEARLFEQGGDVEDIFDGAAPVGHDPWLGEGCCRACGVEESCRTGGS